jgi:formamidopyrimidine-DNA glycosylase
VSELYERLSKLSPKRLALLAMEMQERLDVYQRTGQPCPRCGRPIRRIVIGIRATHFCSFCQRCRPRSAQ